MASPLDSDQFDLRRIVQVLVDDHNLLINRGQLWGVCPQTLNKLKFSAVLVTLPFVTSSQE
jgi:hypothetical protein